VGKSRRRFEFGRRNAEVGRKKDGLTAHGKIKLESEYPPAMHNAVGECTHCSIIKWLNLSNTGFKALRARINRRPYIQPLRSQRSGGVYPRPHWLPVNRNRSDSIILFRDPGIGLAAGLRSCQLTEKEALILYYRRVGHRADQYRRARWPALLSQPVSYKGLAKKMNIERSTSNNVFCLS